MGRRAYPDSHVDVLVVGEKANIEEYMPPRWGDYTPARRFEVMLRLQAFMDRSSTKKLKEVGLIRSASGRVRCSMMNLLLPSDEEWNRQQARQNVVEWLPLLCKYDVVFAAGNRATAAMVGKSMGPLGELYGGPIMVYGDRTIVVPIPHPSGLNLWWNDNGYVRQLKKKISRLLTSILEKKNA